MQDMLTLPKQQMSCLVSVCVCSGVLISIILNVFFFNFVYLIFRFFMCNLFYSVCFIICVREFTFRPCLNFYVLSNCWHSGIFTHIAVKMQRSIVPNKWPFTPCLTPIAGFTSNAGFSHFLKCLFIYGHFLRK